ncbi:MAG: hypothetical protein FD138_1108, partial [Planctomycetota bacterium]
MKPTRREFLTTLAATTGIGVLAAPASAEP